MADHPGDVASTLGELERKLRALEEDLRSLGETPARDVHPGEHWTSYAPAFGHDDPEPPPPAAAAEPQAEDAQGLIAEAQQRIGRLRWELDELTQTRELIVESVNRLVGDYDRALHGGSTAPLAATLAPTLSAPLDRTLLQGNISIDAGLFPDLTTVLAFEEALRRVPGVLWVATRGFAEGRALMDAQLSHPVALAIELRAYAPVPFTVTEVSPIHLMLAIGR